MDRTVFDVTYGWLPDGARDKLWDLYVEYGDGETMWAELRQDPRYPQWFPGNLTDDGRPIYTEAQYAQVTAGYDEVFRDVGLNPDLFRGRYGELIAGDVSPEELAQERINPLYDRLLQRTPDVQRYYAEAHGIPMTPEAILASVIDPDIERKVLNREITMAEIGGTAAGHGYNLADQFVEMLYENGMDWDEAKQVFGTAEKMVPMLAAIAARNGNPDDPFDIMDYVSAEALYDAEAIANIEMMVGQEKATFTGGSQTDYLQSRETGGVTGLEVR